MENLVDKNENYASLFEYISKKLNQLSFDSIHNYLFECSIQFCGKQKHDELMKIRDSTFFYPWEIDLLQMVLFLRERKNENVKDDAFNDKGRKKLFLISKALYDAGVYKPVDFAEYFQSQFLPRFMTKQFAYQKDPYVDLYFLSLFINNEDSKQVIKNNFHLDEQEFFARAFSIYLLAEIFRKKKDAKVLRILENFYVFFPPLILSKDNFVETQRVWLSESNFNFEVCKNILEDYVFLEDSNIYTIGLHHFSSSLLRKTLSLMNTHFKNVFYGKMFENVISSFIKKSELYRYCTKNKKIKREEIGDVFLSDGKRLIIIDVKAYSLSDKTFVQTPKSRLSGYLTIEGCFIQRYRCVEKISSKYCFHEFGNLVFEKKDIFSLVLVFDDKNINYSRIYEDIGNEGYRDPYLQTNIMKMNHHDFLLFTLSGKNLFDLFEKRMIEQKYNDLWFEISPEKKNNKLGQDYLQWKSLYFEKAVQITTSYFSDEK